VAGAEALGYRHQKHPTPVAGTGRCIRRPARWSAALLHRPL